MEANNNVLEEKSSTFFFRRKGEKRKIERFSETKIIVSINCMDI